MISRISVHVELLFSRALIFGAIVLISACMKTPVDPEAKFVPGQVLVGFKKTVSVSTARDIIEQLDCTELTYSPGIQNFWLRIPYEGHEYEKCEEFGEKPEVAYCEPNYLGTLYD